MITPRKKRILVAPLDWGLGHATRCIPIIKELINAGAEVVLGADGAGAHLLHAEFPHLQLIKLPGYKIRYGKGPAWWHIILQGTRIKQAIKQEHAWLQNVIKEYEIDGVISDNRYGLYSNAIPCVIITHQLGIKSPLGFNSLIQKCIYQQLERFSQCWVADIESQPSLAGSLSHPKKMPRIPVFFTGILTRLQTKEIAASPNQVHLFISLSGPEPQRSFLEDKIIDGLTNVNIPTTIVRGLPQERNIIPSTHSIKIYNHLPTTDYEAELNKATIVLCRSGYSTLMDLAAFQKKLILIPTPGQTEQEYLAHYWTKNGWAQSYAQKEFTLQHALDCIAGFNPNPLPNALDERLASTIQQFLLLV